MLPWQLSLQGPLSIVLCISTVAIAVIVVVEYWSVDSYGSGSDSTVSMLIYIFRSTRG